MTRRTRPRTHGTDDDGTCAARIAAWGAGVLSDAELVALLSAAGDHEDVPAARALLADGLVALVRRAVDRDASTLALQRIAAAVELVRRATAALPDATATPVDVTCLAASLVARHAFDVQEQLGIVLLDTRGRRIANRVLFVGSLRTAVASPREVVHAALRYAAAAVVVYHNHPSGDPTPSAEDDRFTRQVEDALRVADVTLLDHLVLGARGYRSYRNDGALSPLPTHL